MSFWLCTYIFLNGFKVYTFEGAFFCFKKRFHFSWCLFQGFWVFIVFFVVVSLVLGLPFKLLSDVVFWCWCCWFAFWLHFFASFFGY